MNRRFKCFIPNCRSSISKTPDKVFVHVNNKLKRRWCEQINLTYYPEQRLYCCEDHLNLNEDLENYYQWKYTKARPKLKETASLQYCNENVYNSSAKPLSSKIETVLTKIENDVEIKAMDESSELERMLLQPIQNLPVLRSKDDHPTASSTCTCHIQVDVATQCQIMKMVDKSTLVKKRVIKKTKPLITEWAESSNYTSTVSVSPSMYGCTSESGTSNKDVQVNHKKNIRKHMVNLVYKNPKIYIGLPKQYLWLIKVIAEQMLGKELDILITLMKIKLNYSMIQMADLFQLSKCTITTSFHCGLVVLANYFQSFVFMPTPAEIKQNLPLVFKIRYSNVQCIIDAFEIEIEKPTDPKKQAQTWSQYKHCNTIKYIVGCTPNGFITFISKGYGGRISDKAHVEISNFIEILPPNAVVMADRGFKEIEALLMTKNIKLLRPPSVYSSTKPTEQEVLQSKVIASLRIHVERVIRKIREFRLLKPHSVVSHKHVGYLDKVVLIACGLINLQDEIIKR